MNMLRSVLIESSSASGTRNSQKEALRSGLDVLEISSLRDGVELTGIEDYAPALSGRPAWVSLKPELSAFNHHQPDFTTARQRAASLMLSRLPEGLLSPGRAISLM
jgi:hypothetical protein